MSAAGGSFPETRCSVVTALQSPDSLTRQRGRESLIAAYWKPVFKYVRLKWRLGGDDAADMTQAFFLRALEKDFFANFDPARARFRTYVRVCVDRFIANAHKAQARLKRGGDIQLVSLDFEGAERELQVDLKSGAQDLDAYFHREWLRGVLTAAIERLREACHDRGDTRRFRIFERYDLADDDQRPTYADLASEVNTTVTDVTNQVAAARRELRGLVLTILGEQCATDREAAIEARHLFQA